MLIFFILILLKLTYAWDVKQINYTYYSNSIAYAVNNTNSSDLWLWINLRVNKYDSTWWTLTDGSQGFFISISLNSETFNYSDGYLCQYFFTNKSSDTLACKDVYFIYPVLNGPPSVGQLLYTTDAVNNLYDSQYESSFY